jgi:hypothetical protein
VGDVWQVRGDVAGYDRAPRRVLRLGGFPHNPFAQCERGADMLLRVDGTADPELWTLVLAARPKAAVGQRWRCAAWAGGVQTVVFALSTGEETPSEAKMGALYHGWVTLVDGTMPEPWEYVGEAEPLLRPKVGETLTIDKPLDLSGGQRSTVGDLRLVLAQTGFATAPIFVSHGRVCVYTDAIDEQAVRVTLSDVVPAWVVIDVETWPAAAKRLACSAAAFAFLAEERMAVHLRRVAVDNAIAACPEDLDPVGWRAAVLAYADVQQKVKANRLDPDTCDLEVVLLDYVPGDELDTADVAAQEAYRRATAPSARVRRRGEEIR